MDNEPQILSGRSGASPSLVERLDPALGEAASGIGAMLTELVRRTLRGGIQRVDDELADVVSEKVDGAVATRLPAIEQAATQTAERTASEVAAREVATLDEKTTQATQRLAGELAETGARLESNVSRVETTARELVVDLERRATEATRTLVTTEVGGLEQRAGDRLTTEISELENRTTSTARDLVSREVTESERRAAEHARTLVESELNDLREKARSATQTIHKHINALHEAAAALKHDVAKEQEQRSEALAAAAAELRTLVQSTRGELRGEVDRQLGVWQRRWEAAESARRALAERVAELEKPRGFRALTARLFGRKTPTAVEAAAANGDGEDLLADQDGDDATRPA